MHGAVPSGDGLFEKLKAMIGTGFMGRMYSNTFRQANIFFISDIVACPKMVCAQYVPSRLCDRRSAGRKGRRHREIFRAEGAAGKKNGRCRCEREENHDMVQPETPPVDPRQTNDRMRSPWPGVQLPWHVPLKLDHQRGCSSMRQRVSAPGRKESGQWRDSSLCPTKLELTSRQESWGLITWWSSNTLKGCPGGGAIRSDSSHLYLWQGDRRARCGWASCHR